MVEAISEVLERSQAGRYESSDRDVKLEAGEAGDSGGGHGQLGHVFSKRGLGCGLLIDWLSELQPDTLGPDPHPQVYSLAIRTLSNVRCIVIDNVGNGIVRRQMRLMFKCGGAAWRPQLVTLLAHRASWRTLHRALRELLHHTRYSYSDICRRQRWYMTIAYVYID